MSRILGATYGRLQSELLTPLIQRGLAILRRRREIPDIVVDGRVVGTTPTTSPIPVPEGTHHVTVRRPRFTPYETDVNSVGAGARVRAHLAWLDPMPTGLGARVQVQALLHAARKIPVVIGLEIFRVADDRAFDFKHRYLWPFATALEMPLGSRPTWPWRPRAVCWAARQCPATRTVPCCGETVRANVA